MNSKREALKKVAGISNVVALAPTSWTKPIVDSIIMPIHAQASAVTITDVSCANETVILGVEDRILFGATTKCSYQST